MEATVRYVNAAGTMAAAEVPGFGYSVFQLFDPGACAEGDALAGDLRRHCELTVRNATRGRDVRVRVEAFDTPADTARLFVQAS